MSQTPHTLLAAGFAKLEDWRDGKVNDTPTPAIGALGELIASSVLGVPIVSQTEDLFDLQMGSRTIEVKARTKNNRICLRNKTCHEVALVRLARGKDAEDRHAIVVDSIRIRCASKDCSNRDWQTVPHALPPFRHTFEQTCDLLKAYSASDT
ncbi:hypothetical protein [Sphingomonas bacterium]|uniref:hypothetical protein n=1 Tax=Sphingomonas bacterium TaxID=1895847 RepID=UPI001575E89C|nr:hypothetical protein [Sphingomonas bacterium]